MKCSKSSLYGLVLLSGLLAMPLQGCVNAAAASSSDDDGIAVEENKNKKPQKRSSNVKVETVSGQKLVEYVKASGVTVAKSDVTYSAQIAGSIEHLKVEQGQKVRKGHVLARIDFASLSAQAEQIEANLALLKKSHERLEALGSENLVSQQQRDEASSALASAEAEQKIIQTKLDKAVVRSDISGSIVQRFVSKGEYVAPGAPMFRVVDTSRVVVEAKLAESQVGKVVKGKKVSVRVDALGRTFGGVVESIVPVADPVSKTFTVRIGVENQDAAILIGMAATVSVMSVEHEDAVVVKQDIVVEQGESKAVFVVENNVAKKRNVVLGPVEGDRVLIKSGLNLGEQLVVVGQRALVDGQPVNIVKQTHQ